MTVPVVERLKAAGLSRAEIIESQLRIAIAHTEDEGGLVISVKALKQILGDEPSQTTYCGGCVILPIGHEGECYQ